MIIRYCCLRWVTIAVFNKLVGEGVSRWHILFLLVFSMSRRRWLLWFLLDFIYWPCCVELYFLYTSWCFPSEIPDRKFLWCLNKTIKVLRTGSLQPKGLQIHCVIPCTNIAQQISLCLIKWTLFDQHLANSNGRNKVLRSSHARHRMEHTLC